MLNPTRKAGWVGVSGANPPRRSRKAPMNRRCRLFGNRIIVCAFKHKLIARIIGILHNDEFSHLLCKIDGVASARFRLELGYYEEFPQFGDNLVTSHKRATSSTSGRGVLGHECTPGFDNATSQTEVLARSDIVEARRQDRNGRETTTEGTLVGDCVCPKGKTGDHSCARGELLNHAFKPTA